MVANAVDHIRTGIFLRRLPADAIRTALFFVGSGRSGTTIIRSLLCAHPMVLLGQEAHIIKKMHAGASWPTALHDIVLNAFRFERTQSWTGYSYRIPYRSNHRPADLRVIGDKDTIGIARLASIAGGFEKFLAWVPHPVTFLHVVRHPMDAISTLIQRENYSPNDAADRYFREQKSVISAASAVDEQHFIRMYLEQFIAQPHSELRHLIEHLDLPVDQAHLDASASIVWSQPRQTRHTLSWRSEMLDEIRRRSAELPHLQPYCEDQSSWKM